jgi:DNA-binding LacI/PurR family transcriptional regulator
LWYCRFCRTVRVAVAVAVIGSLVVGSLVIGSLVVGIDCRDGPINEQPADLPTGCAKPMGVTIKDIAEKAQVSIMTVSRVMNNSGYVAGATREKVMKAVQELNYQPNLLARSLINRKSSFVYVIVPDISNPFYADLTKGVESIAHQEGFHIILSSAYWNVAMECGHIEAARGRMAEGIILVLPKLPEKEILAYSRNIPLVVVDKHIVSPRIANIYIEQDHGAVLGVEHLIVLGHRRIAFLSGSKGIYNSQARFRGYRIALEKHDIPFDPKLVFPGDFSFESGAAAFEHFLTLPQTRRPTALFAASDLMALGFMRSAYQHHFRVPDDISVVGFDDISLASITNPPLTTVRHPYIEMGRDAMKLLLNKLDPEKHLSTGEKLFNTFVERETTKPLTSG